MKKLFGIKDKEINIARVYSQQSRAPTISSASSSSSTSKKKGPSLKDLQKAYDDEDGWGEYATDVRELVHEKKSPHRPGVMRRLSSLLMVANSRIKPTRAERVDNDFEFKANQRLVESANSPPLSSGHKRHSVNFGGVLGVPHLPDDEDDNGYDTRRPRMDTRIAVSLPTSPVLSKYASPSPPSTLPPLHTATTPDGGRHARGRRERSSTIHEYKAPPGKGDDPHESRSRDHLRRTRESRHSVSLSPQANRKNTTSSSSPQSPSSSSGGAGRRSRSQSMSVAPVSTSRLPDVSMEPKIDSFRKERISHTEAKGSPAKASPNRSTPESRHDSHRSSPHHYHHRESSSRRSTIHDSPEIPRGSSKEIFSPGSRSRRSTTADRHSHRPKPQIISSPSPSSSAMEKHASSPSASSSTRRRSKTQADLMPPVSPFSPYHTTPDDDNNDTQPHINGDEVSSNDPTTPVHHQQGMPAATSSQLQSSASYRRYTISG